MAIGEFLHRISDVKLHRSKRTKPYVICYVDLGLVWDVQMVRWTISRGPKPKPKAVEGNQSYPSSLALNL